MLAWIKSRKVAAKPLRRDLARLQIGLFAIVAVRLACPVSLVRAQNTSNLSVDSGEIKTLPSSDADRIRLSTRGNPAAAPQRSAKDDTCLRPPLNLATTPVVSAEQLNVPPKARKEYQLACAALRDQKQADAEKHLHKAVEAYPKYSAAWVTLGQLLAAQQQMDEARNACLQGSTADFRYVPAYLCLADLAMRAHDWDGVLTSSTRAIEIDPSNSAVAYEYNAAANLHLHRVAQAEKSGLRAMEIDKDHREPRIYFVLAQIYEAKHDPANEAAQLRKYLKYANNPDDLAMVKQYLSDLEKQTGK